MGRTHHRARHKWIALLVFQGVRNKEVSPEASMDGFTASWKTSNDPRYLPRPGKQMTLHSHGRVMNL